MFQQRGASIYPRLVLSAPLQSAKVVGSLVAVCNPCRDSVYIYSFMTMLACVCAEQRSLYMLYCTYVREVCKLAVFTVPEKGLCFAEQTLLCIPAMLECCT